MLPLFTDLKAYLNAITLAIDLKTRHVKPINRSNRNRKRVCTFRLRRFRIVTSLRQVSGHQTGQSLDWNLLANWKLVVQCDQPHIGIFTDIEVLLMQFASLEKKPESFTISVALRRYLLHFLNNLLPSLCHLSFTKCGADNHEGSLEVIHCNMKRC